MGSTYFTIHIHREEERHIALFFGATRGGGSRDSLGCFTVVWGALRGPRDHPVLRLENKGFRVVRCKHGGLYKGGVAACVLF